ncbi:MAG: RICIN domain-containing protein [Lachnospiraceae bacterium]|nr:RICIN domain-containing protein [Tyzzerella sp.]MBQ6993946.1 RICIN domain-containing protein [Lachnospiraceae bacterium]
MMKKKLTKILACILCISTIVTSIPITSNASQSKDVNMTTENEVLDVKQDKAEIVSEIESERTADTKTFLMSDGSYLYAVYPEQVHYRENNEWVDVDNSLDTTSDDDGNAVLENKKNSFNIKFSNKAKNKKLVSLKSGEYQIDWALANANKVPAEAVESENDAVTEVSLKNVNGGVVYKEILPNVDLQYIIDASSVKEDIILKSKTAQNEFTFDYQVKKLTYQENSDGSISFFAEDNLEDAVYTMDKPFMYDANGETSSEIDVAIEKTKKGFSLKLTADSEWLNARERSYPVTIDPTILTEQAASVVKDATGVLSPKTDELYDALEGGNNDLWLKVGSFYGTWAYALVYVPLPSNISESCRIIKAELNLISYRAGISTCPTNMVISAHEITTDWNQHDLSKNVVLYDDDLPEYEYDDTDFKILNDSSTSSHNQLYSFDITKIAQKWATGAGVNRGILLRGQDLPETERYMRFYDSDNSLRNSDPCFTYYYRDTKGVEDYWTYTTMTAGRNGTAAVNNFNGNLVVTQNITGISGNRMPVSISAFYDSSSRSGNSNNLGKGWKTNYNMKICTSSIPGYSYYLIDSDGTEHYFYEESTASEWKDEDGLGYTLTRDSSVYSGGYLITDKGKNKTYFRSDGKLGRMDDTFGNHITVNYDSNARISSITDGAGRAYTFNYNSAGNVGSITNPASKSVTFTYDGSANLTKIQYADSKSTTFSYGSNGLYQVTSPDGTYTKMVYNLISGHLYTSSLEFYGSNNVLNTDYDFVYGHNNTTITSNCDNTINHTYQFDNFGKTTGVVNNISDTAEYYSYGAPGGSNSGQDNKLLSASKTIQAPTTYMNDNDSYSNSSKWYLKANSNNTTMTVDNTFGKTKAPSLKIEQTNANGGYSAVIYDAGVLKGGYQYTFGVFLNTKGETLPAPEGINFSVYADDPNAEWADYSHTTGGITTTLEEEWMLSQASFEVYEDSHYYIVIGGFFEGAGTFWLDDLHIQLGDLHQGYNYLNDNYFMNGGASWTYRRNNNVATDDTVAYYDASCCAIDGSYYEKRSVSQTANFSGKAGDSIVFGSWGVGYSVPTDERRTGAVGDSTFRIRIEMEGPSGKATFTDKSNILDFNYALEEWQFVSGAIIAPIDYTSVTLYFDYDYNAWFGMFSRAFVCKELFGQSYTYDSNGNVVSTKDLSETEAAFAYQNNNLSQMLDPSGTRYSYAYDETTNALMYANSSYGQLYAFTYDEYGNALSSTVSESNNSTQVSDGNTYYIRNVTTGNAMKESSSGLVNGTYATQNNTIRWKLISAGEQDVYYIQPQSDASKYLTVENGSSADKAKIVLSAASSSDSQKFKIQYNNDGTFYILSKVSDYAKAIDGRDLNNSSSTALNKGMVQNTKDTTSGNQKWYFSQYVENPVSQTTVTTSSTYTSNGNYLSSTADELNNITNYNYNSDGTLGSVTDANDNVTNYTYDSNSGDIKSVSTGNSTSFYTYENDRIKTIETPNGMIYTFNYDSYGRNSSIELNRKNSTAAPRNLVTYMYHSEATDFASNGSGNNLSQVTYATGEFYNMFYDKVGRLAAINDTYIYYDKNGNITERAPGGFYDLGTIYYNYDLAGRVVNKTVTPPWENTVLYTLSYKYLNQKNLLEKYRFATSTDDFTTSFLYGDINDGQVGDAVYGVKLDNEQKIGYSYDELARRNERTLYAGNSAITTTYSFKTLDNGSTSYLIDTVTENGYTYSYTYDAVGNITAYTKKNATTNEVVETYVYQYDSKNQLTYVGSDLTSGISYTYDANGNILTKTDHSTNKTITYGYTDPTWADLLTSYNGNTITYDENGNPLHYNNGTAMDFSWVFGRSLYTVNIGSTEIRYAYDQEGIRTSKTIGDTFTKYHIIDGVMYGEKTIGTNGTTEIFYFYDDNDKLYGFSYNGAMYYYRYNLQNDVTGIYDANGQLVVEYKYDAWGKAISITGSQANGIGQYNPIRYRGYYYDAETGFYFLSSRYYDPETGRFLNADGYISTGQGVLGCNMFMYCGNNPVARVDKTGTAWETVFDVVSLAASVAEVIANPRSVWNWAGVIADTVDLIPFVTGLGESVRALKTINKIDKLVDSSKTVKKGWQVGSDITTLTKKGKVPSWSTVKSRYWKNEAYFNSQNYSLSNLELMKKGRAPLVELDGKLYPTELHHINPRSKGGGNEFDNLLPVTPWEHDMIDIYRHFKP